MIRVSPQAARDLNEACDYLSQDSVAAAYRLRDRVAEVLTLLESGLVERAEVVLTDGQRVRPWAMPPYTVYYRRVGDDCEIVRVYHQARRPIERK